MKNILYFLKQNLRDWLSYFSRKLPVEDRNALISSEIVRGIMNSVPLQLQEKLYQHVSF